MKEKTAGDAPPASGYVKVLITDRNLLSGRSAERLVLPAGTSRSSKLPLFSGSASACKNGRKVSKQMDLNANAPHGLVRRLEARIGFIAVNGDVSDVPRE